MKVTVIEHTSLDGVLQAPGRADEDTRGEFRHGGWAGTGADDPVIADVLGKRMGSGFSWLLGHRSYDDMLSHWNSVGGPFSDGLNAATKYVASRDPDVELPWPNSEALAGKGCGDVPDAVAALRAQPGANLVVMGSGVLVRSLLEAGLVDELVLMIHPVVLGSGERLFGAGDEPIALAMVDQVATASGVVVATYRPHVSAPPADPGR